MPVGTETYEAYLFYFDFKYYTIVFNKYIYEIWLLEKFVHLFTFNLRLKKRGIVTIKVCNRPRELLADDEMVVIENNRYQQH